jgi:hypothetical protein
VEKPATAGGGREIFGTAGPVPKLSALLSANIHHTINTFGAKKGTSLDINVYFRVY